MWTFSNEHNINKSDSSLTRRNLFKWRMHFCYKKNSILKDSYGEEEGKDFRLKLELALKAAASTVFHISKGFLLE